MFVIQNTYQIFSFYKTFEKKERILLRTNLYFYKVI